ncbi:hypothetical protein BsWGS_02914 [Bradybaena similaris]
MPNRSYPMHFRMSFTSVLICVLVGILHYSSAVSVLPACTPTACKCPYGSIWRTDSRGCRQCTCRPNPVMCPQLLCIRPCPYGFKQRDNGCPSCQCKPRPGCPTTGTDLSVTCQYGVTTDENGCTVCRTKASCPPAVCPGSSCPNGFITDTNGCQTCACKPLGCPALSCPPLQTCVPEFVPGTDSCLRCRCQCQTPICLTLKCSNGLDTGSNGCKI